MTTDDLLRSLMSSQTTAAGVMGRLNRATFALALLAASAAAADDDDERRWRDCPRVRPPDRARFARA